MFNLDPAALYEALYVHNYNSTDYLRELIAIDEHVEQLLYEFEVDVEV